MDTYLDMFTRPQNLTMVKMTQKKKKTTDNLNTSMDKQSNQMG